MGAKSSLADAIFSSVLVWAAALIMGAKSSWNGEQSKTE
jgi:hypothetical protein